MVDCDDADMRDLLPDLAHGSLAGAERERVEAHLAACADCREELALLQALRATRSLPPVLDVARIVAALPAAPGRVPEISSRFAPRGGRALPWRRVAGIAAVVVGVVGIGVYRRGAAGGPDEPAVASNPAVVPAAPVGPRTSGASATDSPSAAISPRPAAARAGSADALGALGGVASGATEDELEALIGGLESLSGIPDVEGDASDAPPPRAGEGR